MVKSRQIDGAVATLQKTVDKLRRWGLPAAVVYGTTQGALKTYGTTAITEVVKRNSEVIFDHPGFLEVVQDAEQGESNGSSEEVILPAIQPPLRDMSFTEARSFATHVVKLSFGSKRCIGWGDPDKIPVWWPEEAPWTKSSLQRGVNHQQLRAIIRACYVHYGHNPDVSYVY